MRKRWGLMAAGLAVLIVCVGCASPAGGGSGASDAELRPYTRFLLPAMEIWIDKDARYRGVAAETVRRLADI